MANEQNLRPANLQSKKEARENGRKGGIASGIARREKRTMKELLDMVLSQEVTNKNGEKATKKEVIAIQLANKAVNGDLKAIDQLTKLIGEQIVKTEITGKDGKDLIPENKMSVEELEKEIERLKNK